MPQANLAISKEELTNSLRECIKLLGEFFIGKNVTIFVPFFGQHARYKPALSTIETLVNELLSAGIKPSVCFDARIHSYLDDLDDLDVTLVDLCAKRFVRTFGQNDEAEQERTESEINPSMPVLGHAYINEHLFDIDIIIPVVSAHVSNAFMIGGVLTSFLSAVPTETRTRIFLNSKTKKESAALVEVFAQLRKKIPFAVMDFCHIESFLKIENKQAQRLRDSILVASDPVACDSIAARFFGWPLAIPRVIREAIDYRQGDGLLTGYDEFKNSINVGVKRPITDRNLLVFPLSHLCSYSLKIDSNKCARCLDCVGVCPSGAIRISKNEKVINNRKCIKCFICADLCPCSAISIRRTP